MDWLCGENCELGGKGNRKGVRDDQGGKRGRGGMEGEKKGVRDDQGGRGGREGWRNRGRE